MRDILASIQMLGLIFTLIYAWLGYGGVEKAARLVAGFILTECIFYGVYAYMKFSNLL